MKTLTFSMPILACAVAAAALLELRADNPGPASLPRVVLKIPTDLKGYFKDAAQTAPEQQGLYELPCWVAIEDTPPRIEASQPLPTANDPRVVRIFGALRELLLAYRAGSLDSVARLYEETSRSVIARTLGDEKKRTDWLASIRRVVSFEPGIVWQDGARICCVMRMRMLTDDTATDPVVVPFAVMLNEAGQFVAGDLTAPFHANLTRFFADPTRRPRELVANYEILSKVRTGGQ